MNKDNMTEIQQAGTKRPSGGRKLRFTAPAGAFTESLPLGNGRLGAMLFGGVNEERIVLNESGMWSGSPEDANRPDAAAALPEIRRLLLAGKNAEAEKLVNANFTCKGKGSGSGSQGSKVAFGCYQTLGNLRLTFISPAAAAPVRNYTRELDLGNAMASIAYEQDGGGDWTQRALLTADDPDDGGNFPAASESAAAWLPPDWIPQRIYLTQYSVGTARTLLLNALNRQAVLWNYFGHGGMNVLDGGWLGTSDASLLTNGFRAPVLLGMTCFIARHEVPGYISLAETLMTRPNGGLAALWAPTGLSNHNFAQTMNSEFLRARYQRGIQPLGETLRIALASMAQLGVAKDHLQIYTLLGDPGLMMK